MEQPLIAHMSECGVVPVIAIERAEWALPLADALIAGGLPLAEITFRTAAAAEVIQTLRRERPELIVGAGTVLTVDNFAQARGCGAQFLVAPGFSPRIVNLAREAGLPIIPGVVTPGEIEQALEWGCRELKFFPAEASGGVAMVKALVAPYKHMGVRFMPTGGVNTANLEHYLSIPEVLAVGGTWLATAKDMEQGRWEEVTRRCQEAREIVAKVRGAAAGVAS